MTRPTRPHAGLLLLAVLLGAPACRGSPSDAEAEALVRRYNALVIDAYRTADYRVAEPVVGPEELRKLVGHIGARSDQGLTLDAQLLALAVRSVARSGQGAVVTTEERWIYRPRRMGSGEAAGPESSDHYLMRYRLERLDRRWVVAGVEFAEKPEVGQPVAEPAVDVRTMHGLPGLEAPAAPGATRGDAATAPAQAAGGQR